MWRCCCGHSFTQDSGWTSSEVAKVLKRRGLDMGRDMSCVQSLDATTLTSSIGAMKLSRESSRWHVFSWTIQSSLLFQMRLMNKPCSDCIYSDLNIERLFYFNVIAISISEDDRRCIGINIADKWMSCDDNLEHPEHDWALIRRLCWHWKRSVTPKKV